MTEEDWVPSPCIRLCRLDDADGACIGCGRTPHDVLEWYDASPDRKREIRAAAAERMECRYAAHLARGDG
jgi:predicted Fe-S protein YdhL (DUF1289 family)